MGYDCAFWVYIGQLALPRCCRFACYVGAFSVNNDQFPVSSKKRRQNRIGYCMGFSCYGGRWVTCAGFRNR